MMLPPPLPLLLLLLGVGMGIAPQADHTHQDHQPPLTLEPKTDADPLSLEPLIHSCRAPDTKSFTCWWRLHGNASQSDDNVSVSLTYTVGKGPRQECPDYVTGGPNSCYFDSRHTQVWEMYCMSVTARGASGVHTSQELCVDVADIVETDPPFNLTYRLSNSSADEAGRTAVISWQYPIAADVQMGWVTLVYELRYRRESKPRDWKVKGMLREPRLELLDLPVGRYVVRVRCKSHNSGLWSKWSESLTVDIPARRTADADSASLEAHIYYCRSPNMETFTCWWRLHGNASQSDHNVTVSLTYTVGKGPRQECPDYVTGGPNSCYFDSRHTQVWEMYCMSVTARGASGVHTSQELCVDVADIVETDPPFNLTYRLSNSSADEAGRTAVISWQYPIAADVQMGWVTLVYELRYRRESKPRDWKVKGMLREPRLELLDLPVGRYVVRVRCKSHNSGLWSKWSESLTVDIPARRTADKSVALALVMSFGSVTILLIGFGVVPQGKRIKAFLLPPVPRPRIRGIDPILLKQGRMDEINQLFSSLHGYSSPQCVEDPWLHVTLDERFSLKEIHTTVNTSHHAPFGGQQALPAVEDPIPYCQGPGPYWEGMLQSHQTLSTGGPGCPPQTLTNPSTPHVVQGYSMAVNPALVPAACQDFYTCVKGVSSQGAVLLCPPDHLTHMVYLQLRDLAQPGKKGAQVDVERGGADCSGAVGGAYTPLENLSPKRTQYVGVATNHIGRREGGASVRGGGDVGGASTHGGLDVGGASTRDAQKYTVGECLVSREKLAQCASSANRDGEDVNTCPRGHTQTPRIHTRCFSGKQRSINDFE